MSLAQQKPMPVIGWLHSLSADRSAAVITAFGEGLRDAGYIIGKNVAIEYRWADGNYDRLPELAADLVSRKVDVILTGGGYPSAVAAKRATSVIPVVFTSVSIPIELGIVASLARPGGNATGISATSTQLMGKRLELLSDLVPHIGTIALLVNPNQPLTKQIIAETQEAAQSKDVRLRILEAASKEALAAVFPTLRSQADALVLGPDPLFYDERQSIAALAALHHVAAIYELRQFADAGGLISYGSCITGVYRQAAGYVGRILSGAKPADLPVQQPTKFELVVNLKTAKALGITVPPTLLAGADEVIE
jgi:putative ABC transport system substrate-binding protein